MKLRTWIAGALLSSAGLLAGTATAQTEVVWWDFLGGGDGVRMKAMIDAFNESHPDIKITPTTLEWGTPYYTKVQTSVATDQGPDIMTYHLSRYPLGVEQGVLRPISDEELASVDLAKSDYPENLVEAATFDGQMYGVPLDVHSVILYYNKEILGEAGLLGEDGLPTGLDGIDNFNAALAAIAETGKLPLSMSNSADSGTVWRLFYTLLSQQGGAVVEGDEVVLDERANTALSAMTGWVDQGYARKNVEYPDSIALFTSGEAAMTINGVWEVPTMTDLAAKGELFDWGAIAVPTLFDQPATWADAHMFALPNKEYDDEKLAAVLEVVAWMNKNSIMWASAGHIPGYTPVVDSAEYQELEPNATYAVLADTAVFDPKSTIAGVASPIYDAVTNFLEPSVNGQLPPEEAVMMFGEELGAQLR